MIEEASGILANKTRSVTQWPLEHSFTPDIMIYIGDCKFAQGDHWNILGQWFDELFYIRLGV